MASCPFVCVIRRYKNFVLLVHHRTRGWEFPGGKLENSDRIPSASNASGRNDELYDICRAAQREYVEETELSCSDLQSVTSVYYNATVGTLFLVYNCNQPALTNTETMYKVNLDLEIDCVCEFDISNLPCMAFPSDHGIIADIFSNP